MVSRLAIIPARGGSKRLPRKNIMTLHGKPMLAWTIDAALEANIFDRVLVSTDDPEIAEIARKHGAQVPFLRQSSADDYASVSQAVLAALTQAEQFWDEGYTTVAQLMPNCPLRSSEDVLRGLEYFDDGTHLFQISAFRYGWMNPWWAFQLKDAGKPDLIFEGAESVRSQDLPQLYCPTGALWIADRKAFMKSGTFYGDGWRSCELDWMSAIDIDDLADFRMAEMALAMREVSAR